MHSEKVAPSLLAADFADLGAEVARIEEAADWLHLDVMDGHFVPNISFGLPVISSLRPLSNLRFDCHLMTTNPVAYLPDLAAAGADLVTMHIEALPDPTKGAKMARDQGLDFGLVCNPDTPLDGMVPFFELCDVVLVMSVEPGFGGQAFRPEVLGKVEKARNWVENRGLATDIQIDGGINPDTARSAADAGANVFVAGTAVFGAENPAAAVDEIRRAVTKR